jgi:hypothetical protein
MSVYWFRLGAEQARLAGLPAACRVELERLVVAREVVVAVASAGPGPGTEFWHQVFNVLVAHSRPMRAARSWRALGGPGDDVEDRRIVANPSPIPVSQSLFHRAARTPLSRWTHDRLNWQPART